MNEIRINLASGINHSKLFSFANSEKIDPRFVSYKVGHLTPRHNPMELTFKLCFTATTVTYNVPGEMDMEWFYRTTINKLRNDMNIGDGKKFYIIQGRGSECVDEDPPMLLGENETVEEYFKSNGTTLYVRLHD